MNCTTPDFYVLHHLQEFAQIHVHWVSDTSNHFILGHPLSSCPQSSLASGSFPKSQLIIDPILFKACKRVGERDRQERKKGGRERGREKDISQLALQPHWFWSIRYKYLSLSRGFQKCPSMGADLLVPFFFVVLNFLLLRMCTIWLALCNHFENMWMTGIPDNSKEGR